MNENQGIGRIDGARVAEAVTVQVGDLDVMASGAQRSECPFPLGVTEAGVVGMGMDHEHVHRSAAQSMFDAA